MGTLTNSGKLIEKIESKQDELTAGEGIVIGTEHPDTQGPCPDGFHVPTRIELIDLKNAMGYIISGSATINSSYFVDYLHMPFSGGVRRGTTGEIGNLRPASSPQRDGAAYIASDTSGGNVNGIYATQGGNVLQLSTSTGICGLYIRPFKNEYIIPDSSWTTVFDGSSYATGAGIFYNSNEGIISVNDGSRFITIADKNLGATVVYNNGDTLSESNCGKFYQFGNNHGFPGISNPETLITSSTLVDVTGYGPGNYYDSNVFIIGTAPIRRDDAVSDAKNLRGGVSQGIWLSEIGNTIINTGVLSVNGQTGDVTIPAGSEIVYCTQAEYDALPSSKLTDGKSYVIYE